MSSTAAANRNPSDRNADATIHIAQLDDKVTDALLWELMQQAAPVRHVYIPRDRITNTHYGYGFCEFYTPLDAHYATKILNMLQLYGKPIRISQSTVDRRSLDVGANLFVGNLVDEVDEKLLHDAFSAFGPLIDAPYIMRDPLTNQSKLHAFVKFASFEHSDAAVAAMDGQYICNSPITVQYAFKKDGDSRERHGSPAERVLAARAAEARRAANLDFRLRPHTLFSDRPVQADPSRRKSRRNDLPPVPPLQSQLSDPPLQHLNAPPQPSYAYQPYSHPGAHAPHWHANDHTSQYPQQQHMPSYSQYHQGSIHQTPVTSQVGWSVNRAYNGAQSESHAFRTGVAQGSVVSAAKRVPDDEAPPPPS